MMEKDLTLVRLKGSTIEEQLTVKDKTFPPLSTTARQLNIFQLSCVVSHCICMSTFNSSKFHMHKFIWSLALFYQFYVINQISVYLCKTINVKRC